MSRSKLLFTILAAIGLLLAAASVSVAGLLSQRSGRPDAWHGTILGPLLGMLAIVGWLGFCAYVSWHTDEWLRPTGAERLSGRLTFYVKFFMPYYLLAVWLFVSLFAFFSFYRADIFLPLTLFMGASLMAGYCLVYPLRHIYQTPEHLLVAGFFTTQAIALQDVMGRDSYALLELPIVGRLGLGRLRTRAGSYWYLLA